jgi:dephospho-CoA kinase
VFGDPDARARLNGIVHPRVGRRAAELVAAAPADAIVVQDVPLLVEGGMAPHFALVVVVHADAAARVARLVGQRGMTEADARARIDAQAGDEQRRAAADVWLDNGGAPAELVRAVDVPVGRAAGAVRGERAAARVVPAGEPRLVEPDPDGPPPRRGSRPGRRRGGGARTRHRPHRVHRRPRTAGRGRHRPAAGRRRTGRRRRRARRPGPRRFPAPPRLTADRSEDGTVRAKRYHGGADPARRVHLHVRALGSPGWRFALLFRDWLRAVPEERAAYLAAKRAAVAAGDAGRAGGGDGTVVRRCGATGRAVGRNVRLGSLVGLTVGWWG